MEHRQPIAKRILLLAEEGSRALPFKKIFPVTEPVEVVDLVTRSRCRVFIREISPYRHTLRLEGVAFRILNIFEAAG